MNLTYFVLSMIALGSVFLALNYVEEDWKKRGTFD